MAASRGRRNASCAESGLVQKRLQTRARHRVGGLVFYPARRGSRGSPRQELGSATADAAQVFRRRAAPRPGGRRQLGEGPACKQEGVGSTPLTASTDRTTQSVVRVDRRSACPP